MAKTKRLKHSIYFTRYFNQKLNFFLDYYQTVSQEYPLKIINKLQNSCVPQLKNFPESGRAIEDLEVIKKLMNSPFVTNLLKEIEVTKQKLNLREIILDKNFKILYGHDGETVVFLNVKHMAKKDY